MENLSSAEFAARVKPITEAAFRRTLTEAVIKHHVRTFVRIRGTNKTQSVGIAWMESRSDLFHEIVTHPIEFHRQFLHEGLYARLLLTHRDYLKAVPSLNERKALIHELIRLHSIPDVNWVNNALGLGIEPHEVRAFVHERIELDLSSGTPVRPSSFVQAFLTQGQTFKMPLTPYAGIWHLMKQEAFFEIAEKLARFMPNLLLSQMRAISEEFHSPTNKLTERCVDMLDALDGIDMGLFVSVSVKKSSTLLFRLKAISNDAADAKSLFVLLDIIMHRVDEESQSAAVLRVKGLMQAVEPRIAHNALYDVFSKSKIEQCPALNDYANELQQELDRDP